MGQSRISGLTGDLTRSILASAVALSGGAGCATSDENASNPNDELEVQLDLQSETAIAYAESTDRVFVAYNDAVGVFDAQGNLVPHPTFIGLSVSADHGNSWVRLPKFQVPASCDLPPCLRSLLGDPWMVAPDAIRVAYSALAEVIDGPVAPGDEFINQNGIAVFASNDGGLTFPFMRLIADPLADPTDPSPFAVSTDKPSIDGCCGGRYMAVWLLKGGGEAVRISVSAGVEGAAFDTPKTLPTEGPSGIGYFNPIVKMVDPNRGYLFLQDAENLIASQSFQEYEVYRIFRDSATASWQVEQIFKTAGVHVPLRDGAIPIGQEEPRNYRVFDNGDFDAIQIGASTYHLWLTFARDLDNDVTSGAPDTTFVFDCEDDWSVTPSPCKSTGNSAWSSRHFGGLLLHGNFPQVMPEISVNQSDPDEIRVTWYRHIDPDGNTNSQPGRIRTLGVRSFNRGATWDNPPRQLTLPFGTDLAPCVQFGGTVVTGQAAGYFTDYNATVILPRRVNNGVPRAVTAYSYTRDGCSPNTVHTHDLHVEAAVW